jgi:HlyD family secretion protein
LFNNEIKTKILDFILKVKSSVSKLRFTKRNIYIIVAILISGSLIFYFVRSNRKKIPVLQTHTIKRGDLRVSISATGTVEPEKVIDVGAQVAGRIISFGKDISGQTIDYGSEIEAGTVLATIDDRLYKSSVMSATAQLEQTKATVTLAEANLEQYKAKLYQAERDYERAKKLGPSDAFSQADYDAAISSYKSAVANIDVGKAAIRQAKHSVEQASASLKLALQNLNYCTIISPVRGVIIDRRVNIGQTVVSSLNAPSLFLIAYDLRRMQVWVAVNEADIGNIHKDQDVTFTVDAFPGKVFKGTVGKVRLNASMTQNVVTYTVEVNTDNSNGKLLPYLTANVKFIISDRHNVMMVPNAAIRWTPRPELLNPDKKDAASAENFSKKENLENTIEGFISGQLWSYDGKFHSIPVQVGLSDGMMTEILSDTVKEGDQIVIGEEIETPNKEQTVNPFAPKLPFGKGKGKK